MADVLLKNDSLAFSLHGAALAVSHVYTGMALPRALANVTHTLHPLPQARGAIQDLSYRAMRSHGLTNGLLHLLADKQPEPALLHALLSCALSLLSEEDSGYDDHTVVDQAVEAAAGTPRLVHTKGVVNAILRRFLREKDTLLALARKTPNGMWNYPTWWIDRLKDVYPDQWQQILLTSNTPPPMTLRVNVRRTTTADYLALLARHGITATQVGPVAVKLDRPLPVSQIPGFTDGVVSVQDAAAQLAAPLLDVADGMRVLDACAAPGGKTGHLLELADINLSALDQDPDRLDRIRDNLDRLQLQATLLTGDARYGSGTASETGWWDGQPYDRILADVPCTASGIVRRHPDIRWLRRKTDTDQLAQLSSQILDSLWSLLRPGGKMLLVTCSVWPREGELQASAFASRHQAIRLSAPGQLLPDAERAHDGLFFALFQKPEGNC